MESEGKIYFFFSCECVCVCENIQQKEYMAYSSASPSIRYCVTLSLWKIIFLHIEIFPINVDSNTKLTQSNNPSQLLLPFSSVHFVRFVILPKPFSVVGCIVRLFFENVDWKVHCQIYVQFQFIFIYIFFKMYNVKHTTT